jgi:hypothetical protein
VLTVEVAVADSARRYSARVRHLDHRVGLAKVEVTDEEMRARLEPLPLGDPVRLDDEFDIYQLGDDNLVERYTARVASVVAGDTALALRVKTTCSDGGDGQVALRGGRIVGLLVATVASRQEGTVLALETVRKYLEDFADGKYDGCPSPGLWVQALLRDDLRAYYGLGPDQHGLAISRLMPGRTGDGVLREGDVILRMDGYDLDDEGRFVHEVHGRLDAGYLFQGRRYAGERVQAKVLRAGEVLDVEFELKQWPAEAALVPAKPPGGRPQFLVAAGLVLLELTGEVAVMRSEGGVILRRYKERDLWDPPTERRRVVFVDHILQDRANKGFEELRHAAVETVNGRRVLDLADVAKALSEPQGDFHVFQFEGVQSDFVVPVAELAEVDARIAATYKVTRGRYLAGDPE